ncbi:MAG: DUF4838 domain-containing protein [Kiritimatiellia bacterium]|jgi:hypothetical protein|nr:DUF4838 domain-containing protein [Kiritimatiellia bacterium]
MKANTLRIFVLVTAGALAANAATIVEKGRSGYAIVAGADAAETVAADELREIILKSTGVDLPVVCAAHSDKQAGLEKADHFLFVGRTPEAESVFGKDDLGENEYAVTEKKPFLGLFGGGDIWLRGNNWNGTLLAVYAFCEDVLGYRHFFPEDGGEKIVRTDRVDTAGYSLRKAQSFAFGRGLTHTYLYGSTNLIPYLFRNGSIGKKSWAQKTKYKDMEPPFPMRDSGHGFCLYMPCKRLYMDAYPWDEKIDFFAEHPEWFSMTRDGKRTDRMQLCFSNADMRKAFTKRVLERCRRVGGNGVLTIGANDVPGAFCWCPACVALQKKYETPSAPYWDYLPELCAAVAREYPEIRIETLAYRKEQSENFPKGIDKFPDNFICDFAPVDDDQGHWIGGERNEKTLDNLRKWCKACKNVDYWFYSCMKHPFGPVSRVAGDLRRMDEAGTDGAKLCGLYTPSLTCLQDYLFLRLALDPKRDEWAIVKEFCSFAYGPASDKIVSIIRDWDRLWFEKQSFMGIDEAATTRKIYRAADLVRWQKELDEAEKLLGDDKHVRRNFGIFRWDVDFLTLTFWGDVRKRKDCPADLTPDRIYARMEPVVLWKRYGAAPKPGKEPTGMYAQAKNAYLVSKALDKPIPAPLDKLGTDVAVYQLPQCGGFHGIIDPDAACGGAKSEVFPTNSTVFATHKVGFDYYDNNLKRMIRHGEVDFKGFKPDEYKLYFVAKVKIVPGALITFASWWGIGQNLANYYPEGDADREFEIWASLKFIGPKFGSETKDGKNRMACDRLFLVDKNGKKYKGETK